MSRAVISPDSLWALGLLELNYRTRNIPVFTCTAPEMSLGAVSVAFFLLTFAEPPHCLCDSAPTPTLEICRLLNTIINCFDLQDKHLPNPLSTTYTSY